MVNKADIKIVIPTILAKIISGILLKKPLFTVRLIEAKKYKQTQVKGIMIISNSIYAVKFMVRTPSSKNGEDVPVDIPGK